MSNEEKLDFIIKYLKLDVKDIALEFGLSTGYISKLRNSVHAQLKPIHLYAFESCFHIPYKIFQDSSIDTTNKIIEILNLYLPLHHSSKRELKVFQRDSRILNKLVGVWYQYLYRSNKNREIYEIKITINSDYTIYDKNKNFGELFISQNQSMIIKKSTNSQNLVSITFNNMQIAYKVFPFTLVSKQNNTQFEMASFGFFSKKRLNHQRVKEILGDIERVQLKINYDFISRVDDEIYS